MGQTLLAKILVVDDERFSLAVVEACLKNLGNFTVKTCHSGRDALIVAESFKPDLVILDVMMPDMTGPETLQALRARPDTATTPAILMTATDAVESAVKYSAFGLTAVVSKPILRDELFATIEEFWHPSGASLNTRIEDGPSFKVSDTLVAE